MREKNFSQQSVGVKTVCKTKRKPDREFVPKRDHPKSGLWPRTRPRPRTICCNGKRKGFSGGRLEKPNQAKKERKGESHSYEKFETGGDTGGCTEEKKKERNIKKTSDKRKKSEGSKGHYVQANSAGDGHSTYEERRIRKRSKQTVTNFKIDIHRSTTRKVGGWGKKTRPVRVKNWWGWGGKPNLGKKPEKGVVGGGATKVPWTY